MGANGETELHEALRTGRVQIAETLIEGGADIRASDGQGRMPMHVAAEAGSRPGIMLALLGGAT